MATQKLRETVVFVVLLFMVSMGFAESPSPMMIGSFDVKANEGLVTFTLTYTEAVPLPEALLIVVSINSTKGEKVLGLNFKKDADGILVPASGKALVGLEGYTLTKKGTMGSIVFTLTEKAFNVYDITGLKGDMNIIIYEADPTQPRLSFVPKKGAPKLGEIDIKSTVF